MYCDNTTIYLIQARLMSEVLISKGVRQSYVDKMIEDLDKVDVSLLTPWQKLSAVNTFLSTSLQFLLKSVKDMYLTSRNGGFGLFPTDVMASALDRIAKGIPRGDGISFRINRKFPWSDYLEGPDIVAIVDFTVSFEGEEGKFEASREKKIEKYRESQSELEALGYKTAP